MPPKAKPKAKKEEVVEIPKPHSLPDGPKSYFIGGWSKVQSLTAVEGILKADSTANTIFVLPSGTDETLQNQGGEVLIQLPAVKLVGLLPSMKRAADEDNKAGAAGGEGEGEGEAAGGEEAADEGNGDGEQSTKKPKEKILFADRAVTVKGKLRLEGLAPVEPVAPVAAEVPAEAPAAAKPVKGAKGKVAAVKEDAAEVAAREAAAAAAKEKANKAKEKGVAPSKWPLIEISNLFFDGAVTVKAAHITFTNCHFSGGVDANQLAVHQYCKVNLVKCSFAAPTKAGIYLFPASNVTLTDCVFSGELLPQTAEEYQSRQRKSLAAADAVVHTANNVGLYADNSKVSVNDCLFEGLATGILFNDRCEDSVVEKSVVRGCRVTGVFSQGTTATVRDCSVSDCGYYGMRFEGKCKGKVLRNKIFASVKIGEGAQPFLHSNALSSKLLDLNEKGAVSLEPRY